jgi:hypothetical protein
MPTAYGLALQGIGLAEIDANLVPVNTLREQLWHSKTKWFAAAAAIIVAGTATTLYHPLKDRGAVSGSLPQTVSSVTSTAKGYQQQYQQAQANADTGATAVNMMRLTEDREIWPFIAQDVIAALASADPQPELLTSNVPAIMSIEPDERRLLQLEKLDGQYYLGGDNGQSRRIRMTVHVKVSHEDPVAFLNETALRWLRENAEPSGERAEAPYRILPDTVESNFPQRQEFTVEDDGVEQTREGGSTGGRTGGGGLRPPSGGRGGPPGSGFGPGAGGGGLSGSGEGGLQGPGRRTPPPGGSRGAPGSGFGASSGGGPSAGGGPTLPGRRGPGGGFTGGGSQPERPDPIDTSKLDEMAPLPDAPSLFPSGSDYVIFPVTFELEIIPEDQRGAPASPQQAATDSDGDQA